MPTEQPLAPALWEEGEELVRQADEYLARKHQAHGSPLYVLAADWWDLEAEVNAAYRGRDEDVLKRVLRKYIRHAMTLFARAGAGICPKCLKQEFRPLGGRRRKCLGCGEEWTAG